MSCVAWPTGMLRAPSRGLWCLVLGEGISDRISIRASWSLPNIRTLSKKLHRGWKHSSRMPSQSDRDLLFQAAKFQLAKESVRELRALCAPWLKCEQILLDPLRILCPVPLEICRDKNVAMYSFSAPTTISLNSLLSIFFSLNHIYGLGSV